MRIELVLVLALFGVCSATNHEEAIAGMVPNDCPTDLQGLRPLNKAMVLEEGYCAYVFASTLHNPRGLINVNDKLIMVERGSQTLSYFDLNELDDDFTPKTKGEFLYRGHSLNHGIAFDEKNNKLYASSTQTVYRWDLNPETMEIEQGTGTTVISGIPRGGHSTRTLAFDKDGNLLVAVGSGSNLDADAHRARVMRYALSDLDDGPVRWTSGEIFADGLRNEVGVIMDPRERIWGVENGVDNLARGDLGGDVHNDNPGEELNLLEAGKFYGYPYCWSEYDLASYNDEWETQKTRQWYQPGYTKFNDEECRANSVAPKHVSQAHMAPLGIVFENENTAFVAFHGSWDRNPPVGYRVDIFDFRAFNAYHDDRMAEMQSNSTAEERQAATPAVEGGVGDENLVRNRPLVAMAGSKAHDRSWPRFVVPATGPCPYFGRCVYVTDDTLGTIIAIGRNPEAGSAFRYPGSALEETK